ncbi:hypothetical protein ACFX2I_006434 [Malus domestica]
MNEYRDRVVLPSATKKYGQYIGTCVKVLDMTGLRPLAFNQIKVSLAIARASICLPFVFLFNSFCKDP